MSSYEGFTSSLRFYSQLHAIPQVPKSCSISKDGTDGVENARTVRTVSLGTVFTTSSYNDFKVWAFPMFSMPETSAVLPHSSCRGSEFRIYGLQINKYLKK